MKKIIVSIISLIGLSFGADFDSNSAKYISSFDIGCHPISANEVKRIRSEVMETKSRDYINSIGYIDNKGQQNIVFLFTDGVTNSGLPKFITTHTTLNGCKIFEANSNIYLDVLFNRN